MSEYFMFKKNLESQSIYMECYVYPDDKLHDLSNFNMTSLRELLEKKQPKTLMESSKEALSSFRDPTLRTPGFKWLALEFKAQGINIDDYGKSQQMILKARVSVQNVYKIYPRNGYTEQEKNSEGILNPAFVGPLVNVAQTPVDSLEEEKTVTFRK
jgi:hypothetical protein